MRKEDRSRWDSERREELKDLHGSHVVVRIFGRSNAIKGKILIDGKTIFVGEMPLTPDDKVEYYYSVKRGDDTCMEFL